MIRRPRLHLFFATLVVIATTAVVLIVPGASAAPYNSGDYEAEILPANPDVIPVGASVRITNTSPSEPIVGAEVHVPSGIQVLFPADGVEYTPGGGDFGAGLLELTEIYVQEDQGNNENVETFQLADVIPESCEGGAFTWKVDAFHDDSSGFFAGAVAHAQTASPGDDSLTMTFPNTCDAELEWLVDPQDESVGQTITGEDFGSATGADIFPTVGVNTSGGIELASVSDTCVGVQLGDGPGNLSGTTIVAAGGGEAVFDDLSIDQEGVYTLVASEVPCDDGPALAAVDGVESAPFEIRSEAVECETGTECSIEGSADGGATTSTITAEGDGVLKATFESDGIDCTFPQQRPFRGRDYEEISGFTTEFFFEGNGDIVVIGQVSRERMREIGVRSLFLQSCFAGPRPFLQLNRTPAPQVGDEFIGLLPNCRRVSGDLPCVERRRPFRGLIFTRIPFEYHLGEDPKKRF